MENHFYLPKALTLLAAAAMLSFTACAATSAPAEAEPNRNSVSNSEGITLEGTEQDRPKRDLDMMRGLLDSFIHESTGGSDFRSDVFLLSGNGLLFGEFAGGRFYVSRAELDFYNPDDADESEPMLENQIREGALTFLKDYVRTEQLEAGERITLLFPLPSLDTDYLVESHRSGQRTMLLHRGVSGEYMLISATKSDIDALRTGRLSESDFEQGLTDTKVRSNENDAFRRMNEVIARGLESHPETPYSYTQTSSLHLPGTGLILSGELRRDRFRVRGTSPARVTLNGIAFSPDDIGEIRVMDMSESDSLRFAVVRSAENARLSAARLDSLSQKNRILADSMRVRAELEFRELRETLAPALTTLRDGLVEFRDGAVPELREMAARIEAQADSLFPSVVRVQGASRPYQVARVGRSSDGAFWHGRDESVSDEATLEAVEFLQAELSGLLADYTHTLRGLQDDEIVLLNITLKGGSTGANWRDVPLKMMVRVSDLRSHLSGSIDKDELNKRFIRL